MSEERIKIAVQKSGRLTSKSMDLLDRIGLDFARSQDQLLCIGTNLPIDALLVRDDDIPGLVTDGTCALGFVGLNVASETASAKRKHSESAGFDIQGKLGFGQCRLSIARPDDSGWQGVESLQGKRIATTYPNLLSDFLITQNIRAQLVPFSGSVELAPMLGKADYICDLIATGTTLAANNLTEEVTILDSESVVIKTSHSLSESQDSLIAKVMQRINAVQHAIESKYIMLHAPIGSVDKIAELLPGSESPTVVPLQGSSTTVAMHAVCRETVFWETLEALKVAGASSMLVLPVEKMLA